MAHSPRKDFVNLSVSQLDQRPTTGSTDSPMEQLNPSHDSGSEIDSESETAQASANDCPSPTTKVQNYN